MGAGGGGGGVSGTTQFCSALSKNISAGISAGSGEGKFIEGGRDGVPESMRDFKWSKYLGFFKSSYFISIFKCTGSDNCKHTKCQ